MKPLWASKMGQISPVFSRFTLNNGCSRSFLPPFRTVSEGIFSENHPLCASQDGSGVDVAWFLELASRHITDTCPISSI
jgi:hypothetical protein